MTFLQKVIVKGTQMLNYPKISRFQKKSSKWLIFALPFPKNNVPLQHQNFQVWHIIA